MENNQNNLDEELDEEEFVEELNEEEFVEDTEDDTDSYEDEEEDFDDEDSDYLDEDVDSLDEDEGDGKKENNDAAELAELRKKYAALEEQTRTTLRKMGVKAENVTDGLIELAAEADGVSKDEYIDSQKKASRAEMAEQLLKNTEFERMATADLAALKQEFPELKDVKHISEIPNFKRFGECRDKGLSPKEAFSAANPDGIRASVAKATRREALNDTKSHLRSNVPSSAKDDAIAIPKRELAEWREMFPHLSDKELKSLYRKTI